MGSRWEKKLTELGPTIEQIAEEMGEAGRHVLRGFLSLVGLIALLEPRDARLVVLAMKLLVVAMPDSDDEED